MKLVTIKKIAKDQRIPIWRVRYAAQKVSPTKITGTAYEYDQVAVAKIVAELKRIKRGRR